CSRLSTAGIGLRFHRTCGIDKPLPTRHTTQTVSAKELAATLPNGRDEIFRREFTAAACRWTNGLIRKSHELRKRDLQLRNRCADARYAADGNSSVQPE